MNPSSAETRRLVTRAIDGDRSAVDELLAHFRPQLRRMVAVRMDSRLKARFDPSDVVQIVLAEAAQKMVSFQNPPEQFYPWLRSSPGTSWPGCTATTSAPKNAASRAKRMIGKPGRRRIDDAAGRPSGDPATWPRQPANSQGTPHRVQTALAQLAPQDREVLVLRFLEQLEISDTAAALGISESAVKSRQFRAIERLGKLLSDLRRKANRERRTKLRLRFSSALPLGIAYQTTPGGGYPRTENQP